MAELFDIASFGTSKAVNQTITATTSGAPQTIVTLTTPSLPAGKYNIAYSFQVTFGERNKQIYYKTGGTYADALFFAMSSRENDELHLNHSYFFPKDFAGGVITISLEMYYPSGAATVIDFADVFVTRVE